MDCKMFKLINEDNLCYVRCLKRKGNTSQEENLCQKCREPILYWGVNCGACQAWFHLESCCNVTDKMFDNYKEIKDDKSFWWFCEKCNIKIFDFVKSNLNNQQAESSALMNFKNNDNNKEINCITLEEESEINQNDS